MFKNLICFIGLLIFATTHAQIHEVGFGLGGSNYVGNIGSTQFIAPKDMGFNAYYRFNRSPRHSYKISYLQTQISADDAKSNTGYRKARGLSFTNSLQQLSAGVEFNFFEFNLHEEEFGLTPYLFVGVSALRYQDMYYYTDKPEAGEMGQERTELIKDGKKTTFALPFAAGIKFRLTSQLNINAEITANYTSTNNLDGSHPSNTNRDYYSFGKNGNNWFFFSGISLSYTFGKNPCYCGY